MSDTLIRVLVIEDNPGDARLIREMLIEGGNSFHMKLADNLSKGLWQIIDGGPDVLLLDLSLPDSQGLDTFHRVNVLSPGLPVIVLSGLDDKTLALKAVRDGAQDYLVKGQVDGNLLVRSIHYAIERKRAEQKLLETRERYRSLVESTVDSIYLVDRNYRYLFMNKKHQSRMGISDRQYKGKGYSEFHSPLETKLFINEVNKVFETGETVSHEYDSHRDSRYFLQTYSPVKGKDGETTAVTVVSKEITEYKRLEEDLRNLSMTDELTGLYNRRGFFTLAEQQLKMAKRLNSGVLMISADLDNLKGINDTFGHKAGDQAIIKTADIFRISCRETDIIARMGGDEFAIMHIVNTDMNPQIITGRIQNNLELYNIKRSGSYKLSMSIGMKLYVPEFTYTLDEMLVQTDKLMYEQKVNKKKLFLVTQSK